MRGHRIAQEPQPFALVVAGQRVVSGPEQEKPATETLAVTAETEEQRGWLIVLVAGFGTLVLAAGGAVVYLIRKEAAMAPGPGGSSEKGAGSAGLPLATLQAERGPLAPQRFDIHLSAFTIGRSAECDLTVPEARVSRQHARLQWWEGRWFVHDQDSANGTFLNNQKLTMPQPLHSGDLIGVGESVFLFTAKRPPPALRRPTSRPRRAGWVVGVAVLVVVLMLGVAAALLISGRTAREEEAAPLPGLPTIELPTIVLPTIELPTVELPPALPTMEVPPGVPTLPAPPGGIPLPTIPWPPPQESQP